VKHTLWIIDRIHLQKELKCLDIIYFVHSQISAENPPGTINILLAL